MGHRQYLNIKREGGSNGWMDGWIDGCVDGWMDGCDMDGRTDERVFIKFST